MKGENEAMEIFELVKQGKMLPSKLDELVPLMFIGNAAVSFYKQKLKLMEKLGMAQDQLDATRADAQDAAEMTLDATAKVGELASKEPQERPQRGSTRKSISSNPPKHERLGLPKKDMKQAQVIAKHPKIVEKIKAQARENNDVASKGAVLSEIKYEKEKARRIEAEGKKTESRAIVSIEQIQYIQALERCIRILPQKPPKRWDPEPLKEATAYAKIITKRLEVFIDG